MKIRFDPDFDGGAWPGPLADRDAVAGEAWLGEQGLLGRLEIALGLAGPVATPGERAAKLVLGLRSIEGFWSRSAEIDPLGSARELLRWRDELVLAGWDGQEAGMPGRVAAIAQLAPYILPGTADRLRAVEAALESRPGEVSELELLEPVSALPRRWQSVIERLIDQGTTITDIDLGTTETSGDLLAARNHGFEPTRDGSVQLLRSDGPWAAAVEVAAWLASRESTDSVVIVSPTPLLDTELRRFGLPVTGARQVGGGSSLLEVLPLVLALGWDPAAPEDAAALLSLPESPVPRGIRNRLRRALSKWPAVGSTSWIEAMQVGLEAIDDSARRERIAERIEGIFQPSVDRTASGYPIEEIRRRVGLVRDWLRARRATLEGGTQADFANALEEALSLCLAFERIIDLSEIDRWSAADLQRFVDEARSSLAAEQVLPAEAGLASVTSPAAVVGPARCVVWWDFSRASAPAYSRIPFTTAELTQLAAAGISLPSPADRAERNVERWRRPLDQASENLLLVSPRSNEAGDESHPHPLWDEIAARIEGDVPGRELFLAGTLYAEPRATLIEEPLRPPPAPLRTWNVSPELIELPERSSYTAIEDMLRCPMKWTLERLARLEGPDEIDVGISNRVLGNLAHALLEAVLPVAGIDPGAARAHAEHWFDEYGPHRVAALFLPGNGTDAARVRRVLVDAAGIFTEFVRDTGLELQFAEANIEGSGLGRTLFGIPDLVLGPRPLVVDAKWGGFSYRRGALEGGTATQLAFYAHLLRQQPGFDETAASVAFFVLSRGRIVSNDPGLGGRAEFIEGPPHTETWLGVERAFDSRREELGRGTVVATAVQDEDGEDVPDGDALAPDGSVVLAPKCQWCEYGGLCGATLAGATS